MAKHEMTFSKEDSDEEAVCTMDHHGHEINVDNGELTWSEKSHAGRTSEVSSTGFQKFIVTFTGCLESFFYKWGYTVAENPYRSIIASLLFTLICSMGLMNFTYEDRPDKLLISQTSQLAYDTDWLRFNFPSPVRFSVIMITAENVLSPEVFLKIMDVQERIEQITVKGRKWEEICFKLPVTKDIPSLRRRRRNLENEDLFDDTFFTDDENVLDSNSSLADTSHDPYYDATLKIEDDIYCEFVESLDQACWQVSLLELWGFNRSVIGNLTHEEIVQKVNSVKVSPVFGRPINYTVELGGKIVKNDKGEIVSAGSILVLWSIAVNKTALRSGDAVKDDGTGELADEVSLQWERQWLEAMQDVENNVDKSKMNLYYVTGRSFGDVYKATMYNDMKVVALGYAIMFLYVAINLGRFNVIEQRPYLSMAGICCAVLAGLVTCGICSAFGLPFGNVNKVLPFLLLGIGVDDMFVIMQCWKNLYPNVLTKTYKESIPHRIGMAVKTAGASITVTSLTDMAAFIIGATTVLPGLRSFCIYAAIGIIAVFIFQVTFFVGWFAIDQKRLENRRDAFFFCKKYKAKDYIPNSWSQKSYLQLFFENILAKAILTKAGKVCVTIITVIFLAININGNLRLRQEFNPMWFLAHDSHIVKYIDAKRIHYPNVGFGGFIVGNNVNWTASFVGFEKLIQEFKKSDAIFQFDVWYEDFKKYSNRNFKTDIPNTEISPEKFQKYLGKFLFSKIGSKYRQYFKAESELNCGHRASPIQISMMPFKFRSFKGRDEHIPGMNELKSLVKNADMKFNTNSNGRLFPWSSVFVSWETDEIITDELYRNICLSLICVLITIFFLLFNVRVCIFCGICVIFTVIDVGGAMYYTGMSIDTISVIANVVAIGLCVDYAAHIGLAFLMSTGDKNTRATKALRDIGPAVMNGGFSTFLGIVLLSSSETHALQSFFKVLTAVVFFGLFHGLVFLPVLLSVFGPDPYPTTIIVSKSGHQGNDKKSKNLREIHESELKPLGNDELPVDKKLVQNNESGEVMNLNCNGRTENV